ncbi:hypothetical protein [Cryptosporangium aurantiacum]|uniref:Uncharacterized protein n=1 Tax=Cryptosporangium aurantiacum TaxID=134849 RepID=A0A1M7RJX4_9ACTN|nr:hypothetical protein [Cryptosporangium aurantiacum]SHN46459.1 hypothetical protein SAMN05443668_115148 [Cryptosporangium aurantiacum]
MKELEERQFSDHQAARKGLIDRAGEDFVDEILDDFLDSLGKLEFAEAYQKVLPPFAADEMLPYFEELQEKNAGVLDAIRRANLEERPEDWESGGRDRFISSLANHRSREIADHYLNKIGKIWRDRESSLKGMFPFSLPPVNIAKQTIFHRQAKVAAFRDLERTEVAAASALASTRLQIEQVSRSLIRLGHPRGLRLAFTFLGAIAIFGIVVPLIQIALGSNSLPPVGRWVYTGLFMASVVLFFAYLAWEMRRAWTQADSLAKNDSRPAAKPSD